MIDETKIMQYADGTLPLDEHEEVKKAIEANPKLRELYNSFQETGELLFNLGNEIRNAPTLCAKYKGKIIPLNTAHDGRPILMKEENSIE